ncbi:MAG: Fe3+-dicitrate receptor [Candidatus Solibacter sp.]|nr:Fe3+-dicitrate receptor [Candidatus Solibacter sp.]
MKSRVSESKSLCGRGDEHEASAIATITRGCRRIEDEFTTASTPCRQISLRCNSLAYTMTSCEPVRYRLLNCSCGRLSLISRLFIPLCAAALLIQGAVLLANQDQRLALRGRITDTSGAGVPSARVEVSGPGNGFRSAAESGIAGDFQLPLPSPGEYRILVKRAGFAARVLSYTAAPGASAELAIEIRPAALAQEILVSAGLIAATPEVVSRTPGSVDVIEQAALIQSRVFSFDEALRKLPGLSTRMEEGFSLRPNIGIRGLDPTRSRNVLLMEDGVPLAYAPYGDNASYYHPPIDRFESIEVVKGSGQILWGPRTVGGVLNYVTPAVPGKPSGSLSLAGGNRDYFNGHLRYGGTWGATGLLLDATRKQGEGSRDNVRSALNDLNFKILRPLGSRQALALKLNYYGEDSRVTYSGLRLAEWLAAPRSNPFRNDSFVGDRFGGAVSHTASLSPNAILNTNVYGSAFLRDWWRQSSNSAQRPNDSADPACAGMANLHTTCGNEGRLRQYSTWGFDPKLRLSHSLFGVRGEFDAGFRAHFEVQERIQKNGDAPRSRDGRIVENNRRTTQGYSTFVQNRFFFGDFTLTPGLRIEHVRYDRTNRLFNGGAGVFGKADLTQFIPGIGGAWNPNQSITVFAGVHRGFAPPRAEDIINNSGGFVELDSELSWNYEAGIRARAGRAASFDATWFRTDYQNQIVPASLAGGIGSVLTSAGKTLHQGAEFSGRLDQRNFLGSGHALWLRGAATWIPTARYQGLRYSAVSGSSAVLISGNRLPYAPESLLTASAGWTHRRGSNFMVEMVHTGRQFGDDLNTVNSTADGQRGPVPGNVIWNATFNVPLEAWRTTAFVTVKNLFDRLILVDRVRGMVPGSPRLIQAGFRWEF